MTRERNNEVSHQSGSTSEACSELEKADAEIARLKSLCETARSVLDACTHLPPGVCAACVACTRFGLTREDSGLGQDTIELRTSIRQLELALQSQHELVSMTKSSNVAMRTRYERFQVETAKMADEINELHRSKKVLLRQNAKMITIIRDALLKMQDIDPEWYASAVKIAL